MSEPRTSGFRELKVLARRRESSTITSFELAPMCPDGWRDFKPGQFLVLRCPGASDGRAVARTYSVSSPPVETGRYRITVKREVSPSTGLPDGLGSSFLHDTVQPGDTLLADGPRGEFFLRGSARPVVLLSGGVGLTPLVSILHALAADAGRRVFFIHACDHGEVHALRDEVDAVAAGRDGIAVHYCYRFPTIADREAGSFHSEGLISRELLQSLLPLDDYDVYLCGPPPFMEAVHGVVRSLGVAPDRIATEVFGPASLPPDAIGLDGTTRPAADDQPIAPPAEAAAGPIVVFRKSGFALAWNDASASLLAFAEENGLDPAFSCRAGICGTCRTALIEGEVDYVEEPLDPPEDGQVLICCARPRGNLVLDL